MTSEQDSTKAAQFSRRNLLKKSVATGAAAYGALSLARSAHAAGSDMIKFGLIGCGGRGTGAAANAMNAGKDVRMIAMADIFPERIAVSRPQLKKRYADQMLVDDDHCFVGFDGYKKVIESGIDVAVIACTSHFHAMFLKAAIDAGKHVFVEKPVAVDPAGVKMAMAACDDAKKKNLSVVSGLVCRYEHGCGETIKRIHDGALGDIVSVWVTRVEAPYVRRKRKPEWSELQYQFQNWYHFGWLSGSDPVQSVIHQIDIAQWALGDIIPERGWGLGGRQVCNDPNEDGDEFDHHTMVFDYPGNLRSFVLSRHILGTYSEGGVVLLGTRARASLSNKSQITDPKDTRKIIFRERDQHSVAGADAEHQTLFNAIRTGKPVNNGDYMCRSVMLGVLGERACLTGQEITWEQIMASEASYALPRYGWDVEPPVKLGADGRYPSGLPGITKLG